MTKKKYFPILIFLFSLQITFAIGSDIIFYTDGYGNGIFKGDRLAIYDTVKADKNYDLFPLAKGNKYKYSYQYSDTEYYVSIFDYIKNDFGKILYIIRDSTLKGNKIEWLVEQRIDLLRHYITSNIDTLYLIQTTSNFLLTESLDGNHELIANSPTWDSTTYTGVIGAWNFSPIYRFHDVPELFICTCETNYLDPLWFDERGLYKRTLYVTYLGNHREYSNTKIFLDSITVGISNQIFDLPENFYLSQNFPNPFNPVTTIKFSIPQPGFVKLNVCDILGRKVFSLFSGNLKSGIHEIKFNGSHFSSGVYFYRLTWNNHTKVKKFVLLK